MNNQLTFGLGLRLDRNQATDGGGNECRRRREFQPAAVGRVGSRRATDDGRYRAASRDTSMALTSNLAGVDRRQGRQRGDITAGSTRARPSTPILTRRPSRSITTEAALRQVFDWFDAQRRNRARGPSLRRVPGFNMTMPEPLTARRTRSNTPAGSAATLGPRASLRVDGVFRDYRNFYSQRTDLTTGTVTDGVGNTFDLNLRREHRPTERRIRRPARRRPVTTRRRVTLGGNYTLSRAYGNVEGETATAAPAARRSNNYPEYRTAAWNYPDGRSC